MFFKEVGSAPKYGSLTISDDEFKDKHTTTANLGHERKLLQGYQMIKNLPAIQETWVQSLSLLKPVFHSSLWIWTADLCLNNSAVRQGFRLRLDSGWGARPLCPLRVPCS